MAQFWKSPLGKKIRMASQCYPELPFIYKTPYGLLKGQMDLVFGSGQGEWVVVDYKTNQIDSSQKTKVAGEYEFQLGLYAFVFQKLYGELPSKGILYFSSINETYEFSYSASYMDEIEKRLLSSFQSLAGG